MANHPSREFFVNWLKETVLGVLFIYLNNKMVFHVLLPERCFYFPQVSVWILLDPWTVKKSMYSLLLNVLGKNFPGFFK